MLKELEPANFGVPVLITGFNRPSHLQRLLRLMLDLNVEHLFVSIDGPRPSVPGDAALVEECRQVVKEFADRIEMTTMFRDTNLGCGRAMAESITWFFSQVDEGIILEDDIWPSADFFSFCQEMLIRFRNDHKVFAVSGHDLRTGTCSTSSTTSYRFSSFTCVWGWATWRRSWDLYEFELINWRKKMPWRRRWRLMGGTPNTVNFWSSAFDRVASGNLDTWDYQLVYSQMMANGWTVVPNRNLVENHGFGPGATHTSDFAEVKMAESMDKPLKHPGLAVDEKADRWIINYVFGNALRNRMRVFSVRVARFVSKQVRQSFRFLT